MGGRSCDDAFAFYMGLGPSRSYQLVADHFGISKRAVVKLAVRHGWAERLARMEGEARERTEARLAETESERRETQASQAVEAQDRHLKSLRAVFGRALAALKQYPMTSAHEAVRAMTAAIKLERTVLGMEKIDDFRDPRSQAAEIAAILAAMKASVPTAPPPEPKSAAVEDDSGKVE
ncbi:MAG: hypothetical protein AB1793_09575 [Candidatus Thermoplasmatota archaeon]